MLILGDIAFQDYEIPERIEFGGKQALATHKLIGGRRVIDAMGPDDHDPTWSGRLQGETATERALRLEEMRRAGALLALSFGDFFYQVVISDLKLTFERSYQILYALTVTIVSSDDDFAEETLDGAVDADMGEAGERVDEFADAA
jgi:hypothetical protein